MSLLRNKVSSARRSGPSSYRELVHLYHRPQETSASSGVNCSLLGRNYFNSLYFLDPSASASHTALRSLFNSLSVCFRYICTNRRYPSCAIDQQRLAGLRPDTVPCSNSSIQRHPMIEHHRNIRSVDYANTVVWLIVLASCLWPIILILTLFFLGF